MPAWIPRAAAAFVALVCWAGLVVQFWANYQHSGDPLETLWTLARFFTIISNFALAIIMTAVALGRRISPFVVGGGTLAILLVGMVYAILLRGLHPLSGPALVANFLLHYVSPVAMAAYWLLFVPHGRLRRRAPLWWSVVPITYFGYALTRGAIDGRYPYPFMDVGKIGGAQTAFNAAVIAAAFVIGGYLVLWLDRQLGRGRANV